MTLLVVGLDGATLDLVQPWAAAGHLPTLSRLMAAGTAGPLRSTLPPVTAAAWTSFMTGRDPVHTGVYDFFRGPPGDHRLLSGADVLDPTLWELLSQTGLRVGVLNVPVTYPPRPLNGYLVPGLLSPDQGETTYPPRFLAPYRDELGPYRLTPTTLYQPGREAAFIADLNHVLEAQIRYALRIARDHPSDFLMLHFLVTDIAQHALWRHMDPSHPWHDPVQAQRYGHAVRDIFARIDAALGDLLALLPADTTVIVMSDHGFGPLHYVVSLNNLFLAAGLLKLKSEPGVLLRHRLAQQRRLAKIGWRLLRRQGRKLLDFDDVGWSRTAAYSMGHMGQVFVNLHGREPQGVVAPSDYEATLTRVVEALDTLRFPHSGLPLPSETIRGEDAPQHGPDLHVILDAYRAVAYPLFVADGQIVTEQRHGNSGDHRLHGLFIAAGPGILPGQAISDARIVDLAPTILHLLGVAAPAAMDGRVLTEALTPAATSRQPTASGTARRELRSVGDLTPAEQSHIEAQLRGLGYLGGAP
ncbi:MAG TPA: alkaline phosphatase family protein [Anaerolineae bacterium]|nr:alkaline phosphatase family protein [Anaerolineae bacterium]